MRTRCFLASGNPGKAREFAALAAATATPLEIASAAQLGGMPHVEENTGTFLGNARLKAAALRRLAPPDAWVLADDSGLCVDCLGGAPGVDSAVYAGPAGDARANLEKLARVLGDVPDDARAAQFRCLLLLLGPEGTERVFEGRCEGRLLREPRGEGGFGYDPLFVPAGHDRTFAELDEAVKNELSHRGRAWRKLADWFGAAKR